MCIIRNILDWDPRSQMVSAIIWINIENKVGILRVLEWVVYKVNFEFYDSSQVMNLYISSTMINWLTEMRVSKNAVARVNK